MLQFLDRFLSAHTTLGSYDLTVCIPVLTEIALIAACNGLS